MPKVSSDLTGVFQHLDVTLRYRKLVDVFELMDDYPELMGLVQIVSRSPQAVGPTMPDDQRKTALIMDFARSRIISIDGVEDVASPTGQLEWGKLTELQKRAVIQQLASDPDYGWEGLWGKYVGKLLKSIAITDVEVGE